MVNSESHKKELKTRATQNGRCLQKKLFKGSIGSLSPKRQRRLLRATGGSMEDVSHETVKLSTARC